MNKGAVSLHEKHSYLNIIIIKKMFISKNESSK